MADLAPQTYQITQQMNNEQTLQIAPPPPCFIHSVGNCPSIRFFNCDCIEFMKSVPDKYYDLAIVDPPYGIGKHGTIGFATKKTKGFTFNKKEYKNKDWDNEIPTLEYFEQLFRVSKNQIIWGANYFIKQLPNLKNFIYWHKKGQSADEKFNDGEIAYTSIGRSIMIDIWWNGFGTINSGENRIHPTQKPIKLYRMLLREYATKGMKILDTHGGSFNHAIAAEIEGFDLDIMDIDSEYFDAGCNAFKMHIRQARLF